MEGDPGHTGLIPQAPGESEAVAVAGPLAGAQLDRHWEAAALVGRAGDGDRLVLVLEQRGPGARLADLAHRAAHVEVDQLRAGVGDHRRGLTHHVRVVTEELHRDRVLVGMDAQELAHGALVAVGEPEARHHLGHHEARAKALGLEAHEPVADARQRREHHAVGDLDAAQAPGIGELGHHPAW